jgi:hypothetical protein
VRLSLLIELLLLPPREADVVLVRARLILESGDT